MDRPKQSNEWIVLKCVVVYVRECCVIHWKSRRTWFWKVHKNPAWYWLRCLQLFPQIFAEVVSIFTMYYIETVCCLHYSVAAETEAEHIRVDLAMDEAIDLKRNASVVCYNRDYVCIQIPFMCILHLLQHNLWLHGICCIYVSQSSVCHTHTKVMFY